MFEKWKSILTVGLLSAFVLGFGIWAASMEKAVELASPYTKEV